MSDIFEQNQWRNDIFSVDPRKAAETAEKENRRKAEFQTYLNRQAEKYLGLRDLKNYKYYAPLTDEDILVLEAAQETGVLSEDEVYKQATSIGIARKYGIDSGYVRQNLEAFLAAEDIDTAGKIPRSWFNGFVSRARIGANSMLTGIFGNELLKEESKGITETSAALREYLRALKTENESLQFGDESLSQNPVLKFLQKEVVGGALESLPYTAYIMGAAAIGTLMAGSWGGRAGSLSAGLQVVSGQEYFNLTELKDSEGNQLIDNDIARNTSLLVGTIGSFIETLLWDSFAHFGKAVGRSTGREVADSLTQRLTAKVLTNLHGKGFLYRIAKQGLEGLFRLLGEGGEEFFQQIAEEVGQNVALEVQRERVFEKMGAAPEERDRLIRLLEGAKTSKDEIFHNAFEALKGGASASLFTGLPETILNYRADSASIRNLKTTAETAQSFEEYKEANTGNAALGDLSPEVREDVLKKIYSDEKEKQQQEAVQADSLAEVTDYRNAREIPEAADEETGVVTMRLADVDTSNIYRGDGGRLETAEYQDAREDGAVEGRFVAGDPRIEDKGNAENRYGYINYTEKENTVTIDEFKMSYGYESLREDLYRQFAERHAEQDILWNPQGSAGLSIREQLVQANPQGPKNGLNWFETPARGEPSAEARRVAQRFQPYMGTRATPLETALAVEAFGAFYRRRGESLEGAMERLFGRVTNEATDEITAAQRQGKTVKGATWVEKTAEGMRRVIYVSKNAADASTVAHEISHAAADDFTEGERNIAARALNGYRLKDGTAVEFRENSGPWDERQQEAFAEALENYLANGNAPTPELKRLFERIKDFMKRIYRAMTGWTELSPQAEEFYRSLFSGELVDRGRAEEASGTGREASGTARNDNSGNDTAGVGGGPSEEEAVRQRQRDTVLADPEVPLEDKAPLVFDAAREALFQIRDSREGDPVEALIGRAALIEDPELRGRVTQNIRRLQDIYAGTEAEYKAPNGKPSLLLEALGENRGKQAWYAVRTDNFKEWFGDWERLVRIEEIKNISPIAVSNTGRTSKVEAEEIFRQFGEIKNARDGRLVTFPVNTAGKILRHKGFETGKIVQRFADLFKTSFFAYSEEEAHREGRRPHPNIKAYHNYVNKFEYDGKACYIRFTIHEETVKRGGGKNNVHSSFISDVTLYNDNGETPNQVRVINPVERSVPPFSDTKLKQLFESVNLSGRAHIKRTKGARENGR
jgi:hypothetical protein